MAYQFRSHLTKLAKSTLVDQDFSAVYICKMVDTTFLLIETIHEDNLIFSRYDFKQFQNDPYKATIISTESKISLNNISEDAEKVDAELIKKALKALGIENVNACTGKVFQLITEKLAELKKDIQIDIENPKDYYVPSHSFINASVSIEVNQYTPEKWCYEKISNRGYTVNDGYFVALCLDSENAGQRLCLTM